MRFQGVLSAWNHEAGYGAITPTGGGDDVFVGLAAFPTAFTLEAAQAVAGPDASSVVVRLVDCSLLVPPQPGSDRRMRYTMLETLRAYLDSFGDVAAAARQLHVHPNTVRYRARRIETLLSTSLADPDVRLLFSLGLRALERI